MSTLKISYHHIKNRKTSPALRNGSELLQGFLLSRTGQYDSHEMFVRLTQDPMIRAEVEEMAQRYRTTSLKYVIVIGIGGSNLGTEAVFHAARGVYGNSYSSHQPKLISVDTVTPDYVNEIIELLQHEITHSDQVVINIVSKSGTTSETLLNASLIYNTFRERFSDVDQRIVVTTDTGSPLHHLADQHGWGMLPIPSSIGGRFSVLTPVGLFPLKLLGIDIDLLLQGASAEVSACTKNDNKNDAILTAESIAGLMNSAVDQWNFFYFSPRLEQLGKWSRQLIAESLGKEKDLTGKVVRSGITPFVTIGSTDLHSMAQLFFGGPKDKFTTIVTVNEKTKLHTKHPDPFLMCMGQKRSLSPSEVTSAIQKGVFAAYDKHQLPYQHLSFELGNEYEIGAYIIWLECTVYYLSLINHVNAFDQPNVEDYKVVTKRELA